MFGSRVTIGMASSGYAPKDRAPRRLRTEADDTRRRRRPKARRAHPGKERRAWAELPRGMPGRMAMPTLRPRIGSTGSDRRAKAVDATARVFMQTTP